MMRIAILMLLSASLARAAFPLFLGSTDSYFTNTGTEIRLVVSNFVVARWITTNMSSFNDIEVSNGGTHTISHVQLITSEDSLTLQSDTNDNTSLNLIVGNGGKFNIENATASTSSSRRPIIDLVSRNTADPAYLGSIRWRHVSTTWYFMSGVSNSLQFGYGTETSGRFIWRETNGVFHMVAPMEEVSFKLNTNTTTGDATNFVVDFDKKYSRLEADAPLNWLHSTNRGAGKWKNSVFKIYTGDAGTTNTFNSNWKLLGHTTNNAVWPANKVGVISFAQDGDGETNVTVVAVLEP